MARTIDARPIVKETSAYDSVGEPAITQPETVPLPALSTDNSVQQHAQTREHSVDVDFYIQKVCDIIWLILGVAIAFIAIRVVLKLIAADPENRFAKFVLDVTTPLVAPFVDLAPTPSAGLLVFETYSVVAMMAYALIAWVLVRLTWLIFEQPSSARYREARTRDQ
jgi:hypothetical protein